MKQLEIYLLSTTTWLQGLVLASWVYQSRGREIFVTEPTSLDEDLTQLRRLAEGLDLHLFSLGSDTAAGWLSCSALDLAITDVVVDYLDSAGLSARFGAPQGLVIAPPDDYPACLKAAVLAVRMGWVMLPWMAEDPAIEAIRALSLAQPCVVVDSDSGSLRALPDMGLDTIWLQTDAEIYTYLKNAGKTVDYLLTVNSYDIDPPQSAGASLSEGWVRGLSLLAPVMASYRQVFLVDVRQANPAPMLIETSINQLVAELSVDPHYHGILASPGAVPLIYGPCLELDYCAEEAVRDLYIRNGNALHYAVAGGRLFQPTTGGLSRQILNTKYYAQSIGPLQDAVLIATTPAIEKGIIFDSDLPLIEAKLRPLLEEAGYDVHLLAGRQASRDNLIQQLPQAGLFLYTGHGSGESINTCAEYLQAADLPGLPPMTIFASACSTTGLRPYWLSSSGGLDYHRDELPASEQIGLAMLASGAVAFVGSATCADFQFTESTYGIFMESLLIHGDSVGEALNATRNFVIDYLTLIRQGAPDSYAIAKESAAAMIHQQILFGDPAHRPYAGKAKAPFYQCRLNQAEDAIRIKLSIPATSWRREVTQVAPQSKAYYRSSRLEVVTPLIADMVVWGDFFNIYLGEQETAALGVMSSFAYVKCPLPAGFAPDRLRLDSATGCKEGLQGEQQPLAQSLQETEAFQRYQMPFLMMPSLQLDFSAGYPFALENCRGIAYARFLVPVLVFDEGSMNRIKAEEMEFTLSLQPMRQVRGCVTGPATAGNSGFLLTACHPDKQEVAQAIAQQDIPFCLDCAASATLLRVEGHLAAKELPQRLQLLASTTAEIDFMAPTVVQLPLSKLVALKGRVAENRSLQPVGGATIRIWRGVQDPNGYPLREGFVTELLSQKDGTFATELPPGDYLCYCVARDQNRQFILREEAVHLGEADAPLWLNLLLTEAALVRGKVCFGGGRPPYPAVTCEDMGDDSVTMATAQIDAGGGYACPVPSWRRFRIVLEKEGWEKIVDDDNGAGYCLSPGARLERDYHFQRK